MEGKSSGVNRLRNVFKDAGTLKREELQRRRLLRLEQVRQQSKDIATLVRQKVQSERDKQHGLVQERVGAQTQQWQLRKLKELQNDYESTLKNVGKGHMEAFKLPDESTSQKEEASRILAAAQRRGQEALNRLKEEEAARRRADEERRLQLQNVRAVEEARSAAVVSLPRPESTVGLKSITIKPPNLITVPLEKSVNKPGISSKHTIPEWPKRSWPQQSLPLGMISSPNECEQGDAVKVDLESNGGSQDCIPAPVTAHGDSSKSGKSLITAKAFIEQSSKFSRNSEALSSNSDVKLYDYTSCYQSQYDKKSGKVEKVEIDGEMNAKEIADRENCAEMFRSKSNANALQREQQRSRAALQRVQVQRDYRDLMGSLSLLAKQNAALCSYDTNSEKLLEKNHTKEDQLKLAVENMLEDAEMNMSENFMDSYSGDTQDGSLVVSQMEKTPGSVTQLNVGMWQHPRIVQSNAVSSPTDSIVVAQVPTLPTSTIGLRGETLQRDVALRNLVQRINEERHSLLLYPQKPVTNSQVDTEFDKNQELDVSQLGERVKQQRHQLKMQRSEVKRLDASIVVPECVNQSKDEPDSMTSLSSSATHESIVIEPSSDVSQGTTASPPNFPPRKTSNANAKDSKRRACAGKGKSFSSSPTKDSVVYSMDVSLSSVIMDQTESSSSGSKSVSLHGVQVLVKVCGSEEDTSENKSTKNRLEDSRVKVVELPSDDTGSEMAAGKNRFENASVKKAAVSKKRRHALEREGRHCNQREHALEIVGGESVRAHKRSQSILHERELKVKASKVKQSLNKNSEKLDKRGSDPALKGERESNKVKHEKKKATEEENNDQPASTSTSYLSPPDRVLSSLTQDIRTLISLAAHRSVQPQPESAHVQQSIPQNLPLVGYINKLLAMSRESIDRLNVSCSEVSTPSSTIFKSLNTNNEVDPSLPDVGFDAQVREEMTISSNLTGDHVDHFVDSHQSVTDNFLQTNTSQCASNDQESLKDMTEQCHEKICALTRMIEEVRRQTAVNSPVHDNSDQISQSHDESRTPVPLDSTAYMSPPPQVLEWADIALPPFTQEERETRMSLDPYGAAVTQLLTEIRSQMASKHTELPNIPFQMIPSPEKSGKIMTPMDYSQARSKPPVAFWKNIERCNVTSPTEPHELSTIPELGTTLPESVTPQETAPVSPIQDLSPASTAGTPPDVIAELLRRNLLTSPFAWAKKVEGLGNSSDSNASLKSSQDSDFSLGKTGTGHSDVSASRETNTVSIQSSNSNGSKEWKTNILMSPVDLLSSADEVEGDFRRMGIGWVGAMLRKTKEAGALSSTSSSDSSPIKVDNFELKVLSEVIDEEPIVSSSLTAALRRERSHSTPIKEHTDVTSSSGSHVV